MKWIWFTLFVSFIVLIWLKAPDVVWWVKELTEQSGKAVIKGLGGLR